MHPTQHILTLYTDTASDHDISLSSPVLIVPGVGVVLPVTDDADFKNICVGVNDDEECFDKIFHLDWSSAAAGAGNNGFVIYH